MALPLTSDLKKQLSLFYNNKKCLVTGHTGFKGSWLSLVLHSLGANISGYALVPEEPSLYRLAKISDLLTHERFDDIRDHHHFESFINSVKPDIIFHLAAQVVVRESYDSPADTMTTNVNGTLHLLETLRKSPTTDTCVIVTSDKCYENLEIDHLYREGDRLGGRDPYSASKGMTELLVSSYRRSFFKEDNAPVILCGRAGNVLGGGDWAKDRLIPDIVKGLEKGETPVLRHPNAIRPWQHVLDSIGGYLALGMINRSSGSVFETVSALTADAHAFNFAPDPDSQDTVANVADNICQILGGSWKKQEGIDTNKHEATLLKLDNKKAKDTLGWKSVFDINTTIDMTANWYAKNKNGESARDLMLNDIQTYFKTWQKN